MGSIYQRKKKQPDGTYKELPTLWIKYRQHGRTVRESTETTNPVKARRMLRSREGDVEHGIPVDPKRDRITFEDGMKDLLNDYRTNGKRSLAVCERRVKLHLEPFFQGRRLAGISTADVRSYIAKRQTDTIVLRKARKVKQGEVLTEVPEVRKPVSNGEINRELTTLKRIFSLAVQADKLTRKPHIPLLQERNTRTGFFEREQFEAVRAHLPAPLQPVVTFAYITGWRIDSEVLPLEWRRVDFDASEVRLDAHTTKNDEGRVFPFTAELRVLLEAQREERERLKRAGHIVPWVFWREIAEGRGGQKKPRTIKSLFKAFKTACRASGFPARVPHDFRRTAVRNLVRAGVPERVAMMLTGHKTRSVFERYNIVSGGDLKDAAARLDQAQAERSGHTFGHTAPDQVPAPGQVVRFS